MRKISFIITAAIVLFACNKTNLKINGVSENNSLEGKRCIWQIWTRPDSTARR